MNIETKYTGRAGCTAVQVKNKYIDPFFVVDNRKSFSYGSEYNCENIKKKQINKAPMERWGMLELIHKSGIRLSRVEKENLLIFGDIRGYEWADYERQKLIYEFDSGGD